MSLLNFSGNAAQQSDWDDSMATRNPIKMHRESWWILPPNAFNVVSRFPRENYSYCVRRMSLWITRLARNTSMNKVVDQIEISNTVSRWTVNCSEREFERRPYQGSRRVFTLATPFKAARVGVTNANSVIYYSDQQCAKQHQEKRRQSSAGDRHMSGMHLRGEFGLRPEPEV